jgi:hypothetical protein
MTSARIGTHIMRNRLILSTLLASLLTACGGGGGGGSDPTPVPPTEVGFLDVVPGPDMTWTTATDSTLNVSVKNPDGSAASAAAVRVFSLSRTGPDGGALTTPVAMSQLDAAPTDGSGNLSLPIRLATVQSEVLIVATLGDASAQGVLSLASPSLTLNLVSAQPAP